MDLRLAAPLSQLRRLRVVRHPRSVVLAPPVAASAAASPGDGNNNNNGTGLQALQPAENLPTNYFKSIDEDDEDEDVGMPPPSVGVGCWIPLFTTTLFLQSS